MFGDSLSVYSYISSYKYSCNILVNRSSTSSWIMHSLLLTWYLQPAVITRFLLRIIMMIYTCLIKWSFCRRIKLVFKSMSILLQETQDLNSGSLMVRVSRSCNWRPYMYNLPVFAVVMSVFEFGSGFDKNQNLPIMLLEWKY